MGGARARDNGGQWRTGGHSPGSALNTVTWIGAAPLVGIVCQSKSGGCRSEG